MNAKRPQRAAQFLTAAARIVKARAKTHGAPLRNHQNIAALWNAYLAIRQNPLDPLGPSDVASMLMLLKLGRQHTGDFNTDDDLDLLGYGALMAEIRGNTLEGGA